MYQFQWNILKEKNSLLRQIGKCIDENDGKAVASKIQAFAYVECSAITQCGTFDVFNSAIQSVLIPAKRKPPRRTFRCNIL